MNQNDNLLGMPEHEFALGLIATTLDRYEAGDLDLPDTEDLAWAVITLALFAQLPKRDSQALELGNMLLSTKGVSYRELIPKLEAYHDRLEQILIRFSDSSNGSSDVPF